MSFDVIIRTVRTAILFLLFATVSSCGLSRRKERNETKAGMPVAVAVLPVGNQSQDITMPILIRYFLEEEMSGKGFKLPARFNELDSDLRQMGISDASQVNDSNLQNIGQSFKVDGVVQGTLLESSQNKGVKTIRASFRLISVFSGQTLWEKQIEIEEELEGKLPVRGTITPEWTLKQARALARTSAGKLPRKLVRNALKTLKR